MDCKQVIASSAALSDMVLTSYLSDLSDKDLLTRPGEGCNHLAWQLGHLIASECNLLEGIVPGAAPELPKGFAEKHSKETTDKDSASDFYSLQEYVDLYNKVRNQTNTAVQGLPESRFDEPNPITSMTEMIPTVGGMLVLIANHPMMHAGQFVPVRRALGKPVLI